MTRRHFGLLASLAGGLGVATIAALGGCSSDDEPTTSSNPDAGSPPVNTTPPPLATGDAAPSLPPDAGDAGQDAPSAPPISWTIGTTGTITIYESAAIGEFFEDDVIVRSPEAPDCVARVRSGTKPRSPAGDLSVGGDYIGQDGGPPAIVVVQPTADNRYEHFLDMPPFFFPTPGNGEKVQVELSGTDTVPAMPVATLRSPVLPQIEVTAPTNPDSGAVTVDSKKPFKVKWTVADAGAISQRVILAMMYTFTPKRAADIRCSWPLSAGEGTLPESLMSEVRGRVVGGTGPLDGRIEVTAGDMKEVTVGGASYVVTATRGDGATSFLGTDLTLE